jgi:hypothetical protein
MHATLLEFIFTTDSIMAMAICCFCGELQEKKNNILRAERGMSGAAEKIFSKFLFNFQIFYLIFR